MTPLEKSLFQAPKRQNQIPSIILDFQLQFLPKIIVKPDFKFISSCLNLLKFKNFIDVNCILCLKFLISSVL